MRIVGRECEEFRWVELEIEGQTIASVRPAEGPERIGPTDPWLAPAFWDIQTNGRWGRSYSSPDLTVEDVAAIVRAQPRLGTARLCPTLITAPVDHLLHGLRTIARACETFPDVARLVAGIHLEGPFLSERPGYRGAHPAGAIRDPDWELFRELQAASGDRVAIMTLAPERRGAFEFISRATAAGVVIALGHTAADGPTIRAAVEAGATLSTHLGNGIVSELPRHPNPIWHQAAEDRLFASLIADGHHLDPDTLRVLVRAKGPGRCILVSDASPLAGLPPGEHGEWAVDPSGKIVVTGTPYLAGSNQGLDVGLANFRASGPYFPGTLLDTVTANPARLLGHPAPRIAKGQPADIVTFRLPEGAGFELIRTCVGGEWFEPER